MKINREDVVNAALMVERWCMNHTAEDGHCDCPLCGGSFCVLSRGEDPSWWYLEEFLRTRGLKHG